jgi:hypothetical protein
MLAKKVAALASSSIVGGRAPGELGGFILGPAVLRGRREASRGRAGWGGCGSWRWGKCGRESNSGAAGTSKV